MGTKRKKIKDSDLKGFKYFKAISKMLEKLHKADVYGDNRLHADKFMDWQKTHAEDV